MGNGVSFLKNQMFRSIAQRYVIIILLIIMIYASFYYLCCIFPLCSDDYAYSYVVGSSERIESLEDIVHSQVQHYLTWGGRVFATTLAQFFLFVGKDVFNHVNALCYLLTIFMICRLAKVKDVISYGLVGVSFWQIMPNPGSSLIWLTGSCNYLWSSAIIVFFFCAVFSGRKWVKFIALATAPFAGNSHEAISAGVLAVLLCLLVMDKSKRREGWFIASTFVFLLGFLTNILAPGTYVRLDMFNARDSGLLERLGDLYLCLSSLKVHLLRADEIALCFICFPVALFAVLHSWYGKRSCFNLCTALLVGGVVSSAMPLLANAVYERAFYGSAFLFYLSVCVALLPSVMRINRVIFLCFCYPLLIVSYSQYRDSIRQINLVSEKEVYVRKMSKENNLVFLPGKLCNLGGRYTETYGHFHDCTRNRRFASYMGRKEVSVFENKKEIDMLMEFDPDNPHENLHSLGYLRVTLDKKPKRVSGVRRPVGMPCGGWLQKSIEKRLTISTNPIVFERGGKYYILLDEEEEPDVIQIVYEDGNTERMTRERWR